jgi:chromate reductase
MKTKNIAVIVGSLRKESLNLKMAKAIIAIAPETLVFKILEISELQMYNQDLDETPPIAWTDFRNQLKDFDGILFVTPEYNRSVPAVLKNAIDVGSRPYGKSSWNGKPAAVVSVSPGHIGGFGANHHLRQSLVFLNVPVMAQPEAYISNAGDLFDKQGNLLNESNLEFLRKFMLAFSEWVTKITAPKI